VWSIVCSFVDPNTRGKGLAERMLRAAVDYARSCGARLVEAYHQATRIHYLAVPVGSVAAFVIAALYGNPRI
jgi:GNAT superfamily N-acetyltransferase